MKTRTKMAWVWATFLMLCSPLSIALSDVGVATTAEEDFFPLQVGNTWNYWGRLSGKPTEGTILTTSIIGTRSLDDNTYFMLVGHFSRAVSIRDDTVLVRRSGNQVMLCFGEFDKLWLDFSAETGQSWKLPMRFHPFDLDLEDALISLESTTDSLTVLGRNLGKALTFHFLPPFTDGDWTETYVAGIGPVRTEGMAADGPYLVSLVEAQIGGRKLDFPSTLGKDSWGYIKSLHRSK